MHLLLFQAFWHVYPHPCNPSRYPCILLCSSKDVPGACFNDCSNRGTCLRGYCKCDKGFFGIDCSIDLEKERQQHVRRPLTVLVPRKCCMRARPQRSLPPERPRNAAQVTDPLVEDDEPDGDHHLDHLSQRTDMPVRKAHPRPTARTRPKRVSKGRADHARSTPTAQTSKEGGRHKIKLSVYIYELPTWLNLVRALLWRPFPSTLHDPRRWASHLATRSADGGQAYEIDKLDYQAERTMYSAYQRALSELLHDWCAFAPDVTSSSGVSVFCSGCHSHARLRDQQLDSVLRQLPAPGRSGLSTHTRPTSSTCRPSRTAFSATGEFRTT